MINKMKRVNMFLVAAFVAASSMLVVSCGEDDPDDVPTIEVMAKVGSPTAVTYTSDQTFEEIEGTALCFDVVVKMGNNKVEFITVESSLFPGKRLVDIDKSGFFSSAIKEWKMSTDLDKDNDNKPYGEYCTSVGNANERLTFTATDSKKHQAIIVVDITKKTPVVPTPEPGEIKYYVRSISFGCQSHTTNPSFYSIEQGQALMLSAAKAAPSKIDLVFYNNGSTKVGCPSGEVNGVTFSAGKSLGTLLGSSLNSLKFKVASAAPGGKYTTDWWDENADAVGSGTPEVAISNGDVVFFQKGNTPGAFVVKSTSGSGATTAINVDVIVKQ